MTADVVSASDPAAAERAAEVLRAGGTVVLPTDTVYGLAAAPSGPAAVARLFELKGRAADVPVAVLCADEEQAFALAEDAPPVAADLAAAHWPGPLTLVLRRRPDLGWSLGEPRHTVGVRCPDHDLLRLVTTRIGPIATTSANRHGISTPPTAVEAAASLTGPVDLVVDGGRLEGLASTVVDVTADPPRILRQGPLRLELPG